MAAACQVGRLGGWDPRFRKNNSKSYLRPLGTIHQFKNRPDSRFKFLESFGKWPSCQRVADSLGGWEVGRLGGWEAGRLAALALPSWSGSVLRKLWMQTTVCDFRMRSSRSFLARAVGTRLPAPLPGTPGARARGTSLGSETLTLNLCKLKL